MGLRSVSLFSFRLLVHQRGRLIASVSGVTFALLLMLMQVGFRNALLDSSLELLRQLDADILVMSKQKTPFLRRERMPRERLFQSLSVAGVQSAHPLLLTRMYWRNQEDDTLRPIRVLGFDPDSDSFLIPELRAQAQRLSLRGNALVDSQSRDSFGPIGPGMAEVAQRRIEVVGTFPLGSDFEVDGNLIVSEETYFDLSHSNQKMLELAILKLAPGADLDAVVHELNATLPADVRASSKAELIARDLEYWKRGTPLSVILLVGVGLGFAVGIVICYQILYTEVLDHLSEFATLKAIGYGDRYIQAVVMLEALVLSVFGFVPAVLMGVGLTKLLARVSGLPASLGIDDAMLIGTLSISMCALAGMLALRKVRLLDPAELF